MYRCPGRKPVSRACWATTTWPDFASVYVLVVAATERSYRPSSWPTMTREPVTGDNECQDTTTSREASPPNWTCSPFTLALAGEPDGGAAAGAASAGSCPTNRLNAAPAPVTPAVVSNPRRDNAKRNNDSSSVMGERSRPEDTNRLRTVERAVKTSTRLLRPGACCCRAVVDHRGREGL